jgi:hypothetical protein
MSANCNVVHLTTILLIITIVITIIVLGTTVPIKQVVEAQNATDTIDPAGNASWILDKITSILENRIQ